MSNTARPVYLKLRDMIAAAIIDGRYPEGAMLPSVRTLAAQEGANPLTVAKAYQQFQADGLVAVQRGVGMYVVEGAASRLRSSEREFFLASDPRPHRASGNRRGGAAGAGLSGSETGRKRTKRALRRVAGSGR